MIFLLFFLVLLISLLVSKKTYGFFISPLTIFIGVFSIGFAFLFGSSFIDYSLIDERTALIYILSFCFFVVGTFFYGFFARIRKNTYIVRKKQPFTKKKYKISIYVLFLIVLIATSLYWIACAKSLGTSNLFMSILETKEIESIAGFPTILLYLKMISVFLSPYVVFYIIKYNDYSVKLFLIVIFTLLANIAYTRMSLFYVIALDLFVFIYAKEKPKKKSFKKTILTGTCVVATLIISLYIFSFTQALLNKTFNINGQLFGMKIDNSTATIISYFSGPIVSSRVYLDEMTSIPKLGYTLRSFKSLINMFGADFDTSSYFPEKWVYIPFKFNTASIQFYIFGEGGFLWLCIFFFAFGAISSGVFIHFKNNKDPFSLMILAIISLVLFFSIRGYLFTRLDVFIFVVITFILYVMGKLFIPTQRLSS